MQQNFTFYNCTPDMLAEKTCRTLYDLVWRRSPSDSWVSAEIEKQENSGDYQARIEIRSECGKFQAKAAHRNIATAANIATSRILDSLNAWSRHRFENQDAAS